MANITLTIPLPVLASGQYFKTRYHQKPSGTWTSYVNRTNAPFTLTGLAIGDYEMEMIFVSEDGVECAPMYTNFSVVADYNCITFTAAIAQAGKFYNLNIGYTLPPGFTNPACGWDVIITDNIGTKTTHYAALPAGGISLSVPNVAMVVRMQANMCNNKTKYCYQGDISPVIAPTCINAVITSSSIIHNALGYFIKLVVTNSTPASSKYTVHYNQKNYMSGTVPDNGTFVITGTVAGSSTYLVPVHPTVIEGIGYNCDLVDDCGSQIFSVDF